MTRVLKLEYIKDDITTTVSLLDGDDLIFLSRDGWETDNTTGDTWERFDLAAVGEPEDLRDIQAQIDALLEIARRWAVNPLEADPVWLYWQSKGELIKRAVIIDGETRIGARGPLSPMISYPGLIFTLAVKRKGGWESPTLTEHSASNISAAGGKWLIGSVGGNIPARIRQFRVAPRDITGVSEFWCGIRPLYNGVASFEPLWEAEDGSWATGTSAVNDGSASGGAFLRTDFSANFNEGFRSSVLVDNVVNENHHHHHFVGKYLVLMRARVNAGTTQIAVEMRQLWKSSYISMGLSYIDGETGWKLYPMGEVNFPPVGNRDSAISSSDDMKRCGISLFANRVSEAGTFDIDCYILIPMEHTLTVAGVFISSASGGDTLIARTDVDWRNYAICTSTIQMGGLQPSFEAWEYPAGGGLLVFAGQNINSLTDIHSLSIAVDLSMDLISRWRSFRA